MDIESPSTPEIVPTGFTVSVSMMHGADPDSLHIVPASFTSLVQHPSPWFEHPAPPHWPQLAGQHTPDASYPARPLEHVWAVRPSIRTFDRRERRVQRARTAPKHASISGAHIDLERVANPLALVHATKLLGRDVHVEHISRETTTHGGEACPIAAWGRSFKVVPARPIGPRAKCDAPRDLRGLWVLSETATSPL